MGLVAALSRIVTAPPGAGIGFPEITTLLDDFNRADCDPPNITGWTSIGTAVGIRSGQLAGLADDVGWMTFNTVFETDQLFYYTTPVRCDAGWGCGAFLRWDSSDGSGYFFQVIRTVARPTELRIRIFEFDGWAFETELGSAVFAAYSDGDMLGYRAVGTNLQFWHKPVGGIWTMLREEASATRFVRSGKLSIIVEGLSLRIDDVRGGNVTDFPDNTSTLIDLSGDDASPPSECDETDQGHVALSNHQIMGVDATENYWIYKTQFNADFEWQQTIAVNPRTGFPYGDSLLFRMDQYANGNGWDWQIQPRATTDQCRLYKFVNGGFGDLMYEYNPPGNIQAGDSFGIRCQGNRIRCYHRPVGGVWSCVIDITDSWRNAAGYVHHGMYNNQHRWTGFLGGNL